MNILQKKSTSFRKQVREFIPASFCEYHRDCARCSPIVRAGPANSENIIFLIKFFF